MANSSHHDTMSYTSPEQSPAERWLQLQASEISIALIDEILSSIQDNFWVAVACVETIVDDLEVQRRLIDVGLSRTLERVEEVKRAVETLAAVDDEDDTNQHDDTRSKLEFDDHAPDFVLMRRTLLWRSDAVETYAAMAEAGGWDLRRAQASDSAAEEALDELEDLDDLDDLDPWTDSTNDNVQPATPSPCGIPPFLFLTAFLTSPLIDTALLLAATQQFSALRTLHHRHSKQLFPRRYDILSVIPLHANPQEYLELLPLFDVAVQREILPEPHPWRLTSDWTETGEASSVLQDSNLALPTTSFATAQVTDSFPLSAQELSNWYSTRVRSIDASVGLVDVSLTLVQHAASQGIPGLDELGEELSLLSRLVYDAPSAPSNSLTGGWNLQRWRSMAATEVVSAYLLGSTPETVVEDIRRLVLPYLYVLEARMERRGTPDLDLTTRHLYSFILTAPLSMVLPVFEASKPTISQSQRLLKREDDLARLALACLYGSEALDQWPVMSSIFECLPQWEADGSDDEGEAADVTLRSMATFVAPSATRAKPTPADLLMFFKPLPPSSLSRALDILDVHLESGEILSRWNVPAPLRWFLQSANDEAQQRAWATRMARRGLAGREADDEDEWTALLNDMVRLASGKDGLMRGAFGVLAKEQVQRIYFEGLLSLGKFSLAKRLLSPKRGSPPLNDQRIEELCLSMAREFYDNASSGNLHIGEMKMAYECLSVAPPTSVIVAEKEFIEATSKICSYGIQSRPGIPLAPIEIRLIQDRLSLVARVLSSNDDVYKHAEVVLDIVRKLGFKDDASAEIKTLAMLADAATQAEDFGRAADTCDRMVKTVKQLRVNTSESSTDDLVDPLRTKAVEEAVEVCWHTCFQLGRQPEFDDANRKLALLGYAMQVCPKENVLDVLAVWRRVEGELMESATQTRTRGRSAGGRSSGRLGRTATGSGTFSVATGHLPSLSARLLSMPNTPSLPIATDAAAAMASRTFNRVAGVAAHLPGNLPFSFSGRQRDEGQNSRWSEARAGSPNSDVSHQARAVLARGVGWLIGADEE